MKVGIAGFARSGKSITFNAVTDSAGGIGAFAHPEAYVAETNVPKDDRSEFCLEF